MQHAHHESWAWEIKYPGFWDGFKCSQNNVSTAALCRWVEYSPRKLSHKNILPNALYLISILSKSIFKLEYFGKGKYHCYEFSNLNYCFAMGIKKRGTISKKTMELGCKHCCFASNTQSFSENAWKKRKKIFEIERKRNENLTKLDLIFRIVKIKKDNNEEA